uniref:Zinc-ribbon domain-containing protein n=1 Tax=Candidatus Methanomethylicus mesodigestus TaxID=1867258 RepID=A0A7C3J3P2_9CREN
MTQIKSAKIFCHKCGAEIPKESTYCHACGEAVGGKH